MDTLLKATVLIQMRGLHCCVLLLKFPKQELANIQGARDDLRKIKYGHDNSDDKRAWQFTPSKNKIQFSQVRSYFNRDILDDIKLILARLQHAGLKKAIIVDLTIAKIGIPVVRVIVPGLETFKFTKSVMGWRAKKYFKKN